MTTVGVLYGTAAGVGLFLLVGSLSVACVKGWDFFLSVCEELYEDDKDV